GAARSCASPGSRRRLPGPGTGLRSKMRSPPAPRAHLPEAARPRSRPGRAQFAPAPPGGLLPQRRPRRPSLEELRVALARRRDQEVPGRRTLLLFAAVPVGREVAFERVELFDLLPQRLPPVGAPRARRQ